MIVTLMSGGSAETVATVDMEFGPNLWWVVGKPTSEWATAGHPGSGNFESGGRGTNTIRFGPASSIPGGSSSFLALSNMPPYESHSAFAGSDSFLDAGGQATEQTVIWSRNSSAPLTPIRQQMLSYLDTWIPSEGLYSTNRKFTTVMRGFSHESLITRWKNDPKFTTCNSFSGAVAQHIGAKLGTRLFQGYLDLSKVDVDVPGCWIVSTPGRYPRPGDYYSRYNRKHTQKFGHVGIVTSLEGGIFRTVDGGMDNPPRYGLIGRTDNGPIESFEINGWIDLDIYFYRQAVPRMPPLIL